MIKYLEANFEFNAGDHDSTPIPPTHTFQLLMNPGPGSSPCSRLVSQYCYQRQLKPDLPFHGRARYLDISRFQCSQYCYQQPDSKFKIPIPNSMLQDKMQWR